MKVKSFFATMLAATALVACSNEEVPAGGIDGGNGEATWAAFSIQLPRTTGTRAADATNATAAETEVKSVALYVEQGGHLMTSGIKSLSDFSSDVANAENVYKAKIAIKAQTGAANVWVVVNPTAAMHTQIMGLPANEAFHTAFNATVAQMAGGYDYSTQTGVTNAGFLMANKATKAVTLVSVQSEQDAVNGGNASDAKNHFVIPVERAVAKVAVISREANMADLNALPEQGTFENISYYVAQANEQTLMARKTDATVQPLGANIVTPGNSHDGTGTIFGTKLLESAPLPLNASTVSGKDLPSIYVLENSMLNPFQQNATHVVISATWIPKTLYKADGTTEFTGYVKGSDFWFYNSRYYGELPTELATLSVDEQNAYKWVDGKCYFRVYLYDKYADQKIYEVVRNTIYNVNVSSIKAPGSNTPVPPTPGPDPIPEDVWVTANIDIVAWTSATMDDVDLH